MRSANPCVDPASTNLPEPCFVRSYVWQDGKRGPEYDVGDYQVVVRRDWLGAEPKDGRTYAMVQIARADGGSVVDWRHLQQIKTSVLGADWEAVEIFPAESRLKDPSNARYLWACKGALPFGLPGGRVVIDAHETSVPQRQLAKGGA